MCPSIGQFVVKILPITLTFSQLDYIYYRDCNDYVVYIYFDRNYGITTETMSHSRHVRNRASPTKDVNTAMTLNRRLARRCATIGRNSLWSRLTKWIRCSLSESLRVGPTFLKSVWVWSNIRSVVFLQVSDGSGCLVTWYQRCQKYFQISSKR